MLRKHTKFETCERHRWLDGERRARRAEFFCEGGPAGAQGCSGGMCRLWPGTDLFDPAYCEREMRLDWTRKPATIMLTTLGGDRYELDEDGCVVARSNGPKGWDYSRKWRIVGFKRRLHSHETISLEAALAGEDVGQGWVCDWDHGTYRMWAHPTTQRLASLRRVEQEIAA